jgi:Mg-chelatase subunit ChlI
MPSFTARGASSSSHPVPPKPHRRPVALFPPDSEDELEYDLPGLVRTKLSREEAPAAASSGNDEEDDEQNKKDKTDNEEDDEQNKTDKEEDNKQNETDNEEDNAHNETDNQEQDDEDELDDDEDDAVTNKGSSSKGRAGATNLTPTQWAVIVSTD